MVSIHSRLFNTRSKSGSLGLTRFYKASELGSEALATTAIMPFSSARSFVRVPNSRVLRPGFEPGSVAREATILNRTILPELWKPKFPFLLMLVDY